MLDRSDVEFVINIKVQMMKIAYKLHFPTKPFEKSGKYDYKVEHNQIS